jgi:hypothetical protein
VEFVDVMVPPDVGVTIAMSDSTLDVSQCTFRLDKATRGISSSDDSSKIGESGLNGLRVATVDGSVRSGSMVRARHG